MVTFKTPKTTTITNHGMLISVAGGAVGCITNFSDSQSKTLTPVFEFGSLTTGAGDDIPADPGEPFEIIPGNIGSTELNIRRYDIYTKRFEQSFGTNDLTMLTRQNSGIRFNQYIASPEGDLDFTYIYYGAHFSRLGREHDSASNRIVMANASATYTRKRLA